MAPYDLIHSVSTVAFYSIFLLIGMGFGAALEMSGFGDSRKLAGQFYLNDMTVLKVMFTGIITAASLIFLSSALGLLDYERVWVNPTYLWPGIVGGLIMGVGFVIGGFCPGTSLVASSTLKIDGMFFAGGVAFGIFLFGETVGFFQDFADSSFMGRFTLPDWLGLPTGVVLLLLILMALAMFYGAEVSEAVFGRGKKWNEIGFLPKNPAKLATAGTLVALALATAFIGQPDATRRWSRIAEDEEAKLQSRAVYVHPGEVAELMNNAAVVVSILDVRPEAEFNLFHLRGARNVPLENITDADLTSTLRGAQDNTVLFVMSNDERDATEAYKALRALGVINLYIVDGGVNRWLSVYKIDPCIAEKAVSQSGPEALQYRFKQAVGARTYAAHPGCACKEFPTDCFLATHADTHSRPTVTHDERLPKLEYERKVKLKKKGKPQGGCG